jgi:2'-5' RNA ligase
MKGSTLAEGSVDSPESDWRAFSQLSRMKNHWDRADWHPGRTGYYWYLTFDDDASALRTMAAACQRALAANPAFDLVPLGELHMTLDRVGFDDELPEDAVADIEQRAEAAAASLEPFTMQVGPLAGSAGALSFSAAPYDRLNDLRGTLNSATSAVLGRVTKDDDHFRPHVGIAYCNSSLPLAPIIETVRSLRSLSPVHCRVGQVSLVRLTRLDRAYRWTTRRALALEGDRRAHRRGAPVPRW